MSDRDPGDKSPQNESMPDPLGSIWTNWVWMSGIWLITALGLALTLAAFSEYASLWPFRMTQLLLLAGLMMILLLNLVYQSHRLYQLIRAERSVLSYYTEKGVGNRLKGLLKLTRFIGSNVDLQRILDNMTESGLETFDCEQVSLMLVDPGTSELVVRSTAGSTNRHVIGSRQKIGHGVSGKVAKTAQPLILGAEVDGKNFVGFNKKRNEISASMVVPIMLREELIGVQCVSSRARNHVYDSDDLQVLQVFAEMVAVCIRHTQQAEWMRKTIEGLEGDLGRASADDRPDQAA